MLLGVLIALPALGTDLYIPALPEVSRSLDAPVAATQATLTMYFVGLAGGQLIWGPLSDRYGRKPVLAAGLSTLIVSSLAAAAASSVGAIAAARVAQGSAPRAARSSAAPSCAISMPTKPRRGCWRA